jgi:hypothetical protein
MIRVLLTSLCLFLLEVYLFCTFSPELLQNFSGIDLKYLTFTGKQRRVVHNIQRQKTLNRQTKPAIYVLGGSTSREFFYVDAQMRRITGRPFVNMSASNQTLFDSLRLADNIQGDDATIIYCLFPFKFMRYAPKVPADSRYLMGAYLKYPVASSALESLLDDVAPRNLATALLAELNVYCYLLKNYVIQKNYNLQYKLAGIPTPPLKTLFINDRPPGQHFYRRQAQNRNHLQLTLLNIKKEIGSNLEANLDINFTHLGHLIDLTQQHGLQIKLLELPYSYTFKRMYQRELGIYRQHLDAFLQIYAQVPFMRIDFEIYQGREELFYDHGHLLDRGRDYFHPLVETVFEEDIRHATHR